MLKKLLLVATITSAVTWQACEYEVLPAELNCDENPVALALVAAEDANCAMADGRVEVTASGGGGTYQYKIGEGELQPSPVFEGLSAGLYVVTAIDKNNCEDTLEVTVLNQNGMNATFTATDAGGCKNTDGSVTINAFDGTEPYSYSMNGGTGSSNATFQGLARGEYQFLVSDASGCEVTQTIRIRSGISFKDSIKPIIDTNCVKSGCHNGTQFPDLRVYKNIHDNAGQVKALTANRSMPVNGSLSQAEIDMIGCWVDDGALDN